MTQQQGHSHQPASGKPVLTASAPNNSRRNLILGLVALLLIAGAVGGRMLYVKSKEPPRFNAPIDTLAKFVTKPGFNELPFERRELYIQKLDERDDELEAAWDTGKLTDLEYKAAIEMSWFARQLREMHTYHQLPTQDEKNKMLDRLLDEKKRDKDKTKTPGTGASKTPGTGTSKTPGTGTAKVGTTPPKTPVATSGRPKPKRDEIQEQVIPQAWPESDRVRWVQFREAIKQRDNERDKARKAAEKAAKRAATQPVAK